MAPTIRHKTCCFRCAPEIQSDGSRPRVPPLNLGASQLSGDSFRCTKSHARATLAWACAGNGRGPYAPALSWLPGGVGREKCVVGGISTKIVRRARHA
jgi:hypothetical protein